MSQTSLSQAEAQAKINQIDDALQRLRQHGQSMQDRTAQMTASSWLGNQSQLFAQTMQQHTDDFHAVINQVTELAETGKSNMLALVNLDAE